MDKTKLSFNWQSFHEFQSKYSKIRCGFSNLINAEFRLIRFPPSISKHKQYWWLIFWDLARPTAVDGQCTYPRGVCFDSNPKRNLVRFLRFVQFFLSGVCWDWARLWPFLFHMRHLRGEKKIDNSSLRLKMKFWIHFLWYIILESSHGDYTFRKLVKVRQTLINELICKV